MHTVNKRTTAKTYTLHQDGDTIVEVLIAVAVICSVLVGAFLVSQKSVIGVRDSQEHSEMLQLLQGQVEQVRALALDKTTSSLMYSSTPKYFCVDQTTDTRVNFASSVTAAGLSDVNNYPAACEFGTNGRYHIAVTYDTSGGHNVFVFTGIWDSSTGGTGKETLTYRI